MNKDIYEKVKSERIRQDKKWGFPQALTPMELGSVLAEETGELCQCLNDLRSSQASLTDELYQDIEDEAVQVAAVAVSIIEHMRNKRLVHPVGEI